MQAGKALEEDNGVLIQASSCAAVQGLPWWGGVPSPAVSSNPLKHVMAENPGTVVGVSASLQGSGFIQPHPSTQTSAPLLVHSLADGQGPSIGTVRMSTWPSSGYENEQQLIAVSAPLPAPGPTPVLLQSQAEYMLPHTQLELGHSMVRAAYPYTDPFFGGIMAAYGTHAMVQPHLLGVQQARMPLPSEMTEEEPVYVNAKQYNGILRRRQSRAKAESENKLVKTRKPYLHESRHLHAMRRARGCGGRFLNTKKKDEAKANSGSNASSESQSSQEGTGIDSHETPVSGILMGPQNQDFNSLQGLTGHLMAGMGQSVVGGSGYCSGMLVQSNPIMSSGLPFGT
ncbi:hypothetical protein L7F22_012621 [Adiantum nelumboides]|nr:hypothetical protein [Adiantum nelumboides]